MEDSRINFTKKLPQNKDPKPKIVEKKEQPQQKIKTFSHKEKIILGKYQILKNIEKNKDLQIYEGKIIISDELIIIKIEQKKDKKKKGILEIESHYLNYLKSPGIPIIKKILTNLTKVKVQKV